MSYKLMSDRSLQSISRRIYTEVLVDLKREIHTYMTYNQLTFIIMIINQGEVKMFFKKEKKDVGQDEKNKKPTYWARVIHGKGTAAEPQPAAEELWKNPKVKKAIENHNELIAKRNES